MIAVYAEFDLPALPHGFVYYGPSNRPRDRESNCVCNSVFYSLLSACGYCQERDWIPYVLYDSFALITLAHCYTSVGLYTISTVPTLHQWDCKFFTFSFRFSKMLIGNRYWPAIPAEVRVPAWAYLSIVLSFLSSDISDLIR